MRVLHCDDEYGHGSLIVSLTEWEYKILASGGKPEFGACIDLMPILDAVKRVKKSQTLLSEVVQILEMNGE